jgi:hypothetical protein
MAEGQAGLVPILGKLSGRDVDKGGLCAESGHRWVRRKLGEGPEMDLLDACQAYMRLRPTGQWQVRRAGGAVWPDGGQGR